MAGAIVEDLLLLEEGVVMYDSALDREVFVVAPVLVIIADNPRHSELINHLGSSAKLICAAVHVHLQRNIILCALY